MKKKNWICGTAFILIAVLVATMILVDRSEIIVHADEGTGDEVMLPHIHSEEGGVCYHHHNGDTAAGGDCYTVPILCGGNVTAKTGETYCGNITLQSQGIDSTSGQYRYYFSCNACGQMWDRAENDMGGAHMRPGTYYSCDSCGTRYSSGGSCTKVAAYETGCGMNEQMLDCADTICGSYHITCSDVTMGLESTALTANVSSQGVGASVTSYLWSTGENTQSITVTQNGTYSCEITYTDQKSGASSTVAASYAVANLDNTPPEVSLSFGPTAPTSTGTTIHVDATDNIGVTGYSFDGVSFSAEQDLYVTENGTYTAYAADAAGNIGSSAITVDNIDQEAPEILSVTKSAEGPYINGNLEVCVSAQDKVSEGYAREVTVEYSIDGENWNGSGEFHITVDGTQEILVRDAAGNISTALVTAYQDTTPPCVSGTQNPKGWTRDAVRLSVTASDDQSGIPEWAYKWMDGDWNTASDINVTANGTYPVTVRDAAGNTAAYTFHVTQIDRTAPKLEAHLGTADWYDGANIIYVQASDSESGLAGEAYSYDGGSTWTASAQYEISASGDYLVLVRDAVGNIAESRIYAEKMTVIPDPAEDRTEPMEDETEEYHSHWHNKELTGEIPMSTEEPEPGVNMPPMIQTISQISDPDQDQDEYVPKIILSISIPRSSSPNQGAGEGEPGALLDPQTTRQTALGSWILKALAAIICGICMGCLFFAALRAKKAALYEQEPGNTEYHLVDRLKIKRRSEGKGYVVKITDRQLAERITESVNKQSVFREQEQRHYMFKFGRHFAKWHKEERLEILFCTSDWMLKKVEREVKL